MDTMHIGLCVICTGKYERFLRSLYASAIQCFCPDARRSFFLFADKPFDGDCHFHWQPIRTAHGPARRSIATTTCCWPTSPREV